MIEPLLAWSTHLLRFFVATRGVHCPGDPFQATDFVLGGPAVLVVIFRIHSLEDLSHDEKNYIVRACETL